MVTAVVDGGGVGGGGLPPAVALVAAVAGVVATGGGGGGGGGAAMAAVAVSVAAVGVAAAAGAAAAAPASAPPASAASAPSLSAAASAGVAEPPSTLPPGTHLLRVTCPTATAIELLNGDTVRLRAATPTTLAFRLHADATAAARQLVARHGGDVSFVAFRTTEGGGVVATRVHPRDLCVAGAPVWVGLPPRGGGRCLLPTRGGRRR